MKAIVTGMMATYPLGGVAWDYGQYVLGMQRLGFDVTYLEDTGAPSYDSRRGEYGYDGAYAAESLAQSLRTLAGEAPPPWHYRAADGTAHGMAESEIITAVAEADILLNVSGGLLLRKAWTRSRKTVLIDTDPGWNHFVNYPKWDAGQGYPGVESFRAHDAFFTYAEAIGTPRCSLPDLDIAWQPTRPPVVLDAWRPDGPGERWTTVMTWDNFRQPIEGNGVTYGTKEREVLAIEGLPKRVDSRLEIAVDGENVPREHLREMGWSIVPSAPISVTPDTYRDYIQQSRGEFSVAKNVYVATGSGWFSCRSVCYLAAGRPVILQDTGYSAIIPTGDGLLAWGSIDDARHALDKVEADYEDHSRAARELAVQEFAAEKVLGDLLDRAGLG